MKIWGPFTAMLAPESKPLATEPICVQDGSLRAYIWPTKGQFSYEVVNGYGERLWVGTAGSGAARNAAVHYLAKLRGDWQ
jgi:hypothetical protein